MKDQRGGVIFLMIASMALHYYTAAAVFCVCAVLLNEMRAQRGAE